MHLFELFDAGFSLHWSLVLLHFLWQGCVVALLAILASWFLRRAAANARYAANVLALAVMAACVPATYALVEVPVAAVAAAALDEPVAPPAASISATDVAPVEPGVAPLLPSEALVEAIPIEDVGSLPAAVPAAPPIADSNSAPQGTQAISSDRWLRFVKPASPYLTACYLAGVALMLLRLAASLWGGRRLRLAATPIHDAGLLTLLDRQLRRLGLRTVPVVAWCGRVSVPVVIGVFRPMILLPASLATGLAPSQLEALLTHELAHIRRFDLAVNLLQRLIEAALFFHPAVWYVSRRLGIERENACDDVVLSAGWRRVEYADALVRMAEVCAELRTQPAPAATLAASGAKPSQFQQRVQRLLGVSEAPRYRLSPVGGVMLLLGLTAVLFTPALVQSWPNERAGRAPEIINEFGKYPSPSGLYEVRVFDVDDDHWLYSVHKRANKAERQGPTQPIPRAKTWFMAWDDADRLWTYVKADGVRTWFWNDEAIVTESAGVGGGWNGIPEAFFERLPRSEKKKRKTYEHTRKEQPSHEAELPQIVRAQLRVTKDGQAEWSEPLKGVRVRLTAPHGNKYRHDERLPLLVEMQNVTDKPIRFADLHPNCDVKVYSTTDAWLGVARTDIAIGPWEGVPGAFAPMQVLRWTIWFDRLRLNKPITAGSTVQVRVGVPRQIEEPGELPRTTYSEPVLVRLIDAPPVVLKEVGNPPQITAKDVTETWSEDIEIVYREVGGLSLPSRAIHIDGQGKVTMLHCGGPGRTQTRLERNRLDALAARVRELKIWELAEVQWRLANPDEGDVRISLTYGAKTLVGDYANGLVRDNKTLSAFKTEMSAVIDEAVQTINKREDDGPDGFASEDAPKLGTLAGRFVFDGDPPQPKRHAIPTERRTLDNRSFPDPELAHYNRLGLTDESLVVGKDGGIKNVLVWILSKDVPVAPGKDQAEKPVLRLKDGQFQPHVLPFQVPQTLVLTNEAVHAANFHWEPYLSEAFNILVAPTRTKEATITRPDGLPSPLGSDVHPWMKAWLFPCEHHFSAVSADDGTFVIDDIPPGEWEFQIWHERTGYVERDGWPKGRFTLKIEPGEHDLGVVKLGPEMFDEKAAAEKGEEHDKGNDDKPRPATGRIAGRVLLPNVAGYRVVDGRVVPMVYKDGKLLLDEGEDPNDLKPLRVNAVLVREFKPETNTWSKSRRVAVDSQVFVVENVRPGRVRITPTFDVFDKGLVYLQALEMETRVEAGKTVRVTLNDKGPDVIGKVALPDALAVVHDEIRVRIYPHAPPFLVTVDADGESNAGPAWDIYAAFAGPPRRQSDIRLDAEGRFRFEGVPPGKYWVQVTAPVKAGVNNRPLATTPFIVPLSPDGAKPEPVDLGVIAVEPPDAANAEKERDAAAAADSNDEADLYQASVNIKNEKGKDLIISLHELQRREKDSIIQVRFTSGGSVGSSLWIAKGMYEIAKLRKAKYFIKLHEWVDDDGHHRYRIGFCTDKTVDPREYFGGEIDEKSENKFVDVEQYDTLLKPFVDHKRREQNGGNGDTGSDSAKNPSPKNDDVDRKDPNPADRELNVDVTGICLTSEDGSPVADAEVRFYVFHMDPYRLEFWKAVGTDKDGKFAIQGTFPSGPTADPLRSRICVVAPGRATRWFFWQPDAKYDPPLELQIKPPGSIRGRVVGPDGQPVAGAVVHAGPNRMDGLFDAVTGADGRYEIDDMEAWVPDGEPDAFGFRDVRRTMLVIHPDFGTRRSSYTRIPSTVNVQFAKPAVVEGRVLDATGRPVAKVLVQAQGEAWYEAFTNDDGRYRLLIQHEGEYRVWALRQGEDNPPKIRVLAGAGATTLAPDIRLRED